MSTLTLRPNAGGTHTELQSYDGTLRDPNVDFNYTMVDEAIQDGIGTLVGDWGASPQAYKHDTYNVPNHTTETGTINSVKVYICVYGSASGEYRYYRCVIRSNGTTTDGTEITVTNEGSGTYILKSQTWTLNPFTSAAWTWGEIDALEIGCGLEKKVNNSPYVTQVYVEVDYTPPVVVTPPTLALSLTTYAPNVIIGTVVTPATLALILTSYVPTVEFTEHITVIPATLALTLTTFVPTVFTPRLVTPPTLALVLTTYAPTVSTSVLVTPATLALILTTYAPRLWSSFKKLRLHPYAYTRARKVEK